MTYSQRAHQTLLDVSYDDELEVTGSFSLILGDNLSTPRLDMRCLSESIPVL